MHKNNRLSQLRRLLTLAISAVFASSTSAADVTVSGAVTSTVSSTANGDVITITESGSITTIPDNTDGVFFTNTNVSVINSGAISTQGNGSDGIESLLTGDNASVTNNGSITTQSNSANGILTRGDNDAINNNGTISTQGNLSAGIRTEGDAPTISNSGMIMTQGVSSEVINLTGNNAIITNNGTISSQGSGSEVINLTGNNAIITNNGSIMSTGFTAEGIESIGGNNHTIVNNGTITTTGNAAEGIATTGDKIHITNNGTINALGGASAIETTGDNNTIINTGNTFATSQPTIEASGDNVTIVNTGSVVNQSAGSHGISITGANTTITNSGTVQVSGAGARAVNLSANSNENTVLNNSGAIIATGDATTAILGAGGSETLNLGAGSQILGIIDLAGGTDIVNILGASPSAQLTLVGVESINIAQGAAAVTNGTTTVTTVDPTGDAVRSTSLGVMASGIHNVITRRSINNKPLKPVQLASLELTPGMLFQERGPLAWGEIFGSRRSRGAERNVAAHNHSYGGFVGGYERDYKKSRLGVMAGYANSDIQTEVNSIDTDTHSFFAGGYGHFHLGAINLTAVLMGGYEEHDNDRTVFDNLNGIESASSEFSSVFFSPSITLSSGIKLSEQYEFRPSASLAYTVSWYDDYSESGTTASNLSIDDRTTHALNSRLQLAAAYLGNENSEVELRVGAKSRHVDEDDVDASLAGTNFSYSSQADENDYGGFVGANVKVALLQSLQFVTDIEYSVMDGGEDERQISGRMSLDYLF